MIFNEIGLIWPDFLFNLLKFRCNHYFDWYSIRISLCVIFHWISHDLAPSAAAAIDSHASCYRTLRNSIALRLLDPFSSSSTTSHAFNRLFTRFLIILPMNRFLLFFYQSEPLSHFSCLFSSLIHGFIILFTRFALLMTLDWWTIKYLIKFFPFSPIFINIRAIPILSH